MVGLRYGRALSIIEVSSIINSYSPEGSVNVGGGLNSSISGSDTANIGAASRWSDRPTITYVPTRGRTFTQNLLTPIPPASLHSLFQSGWPADLVFGLGANAMNGIVQRRNHWFYIDDRDFASKRVFSVLLIFLSLAETGQTSGGPALTISQ
jgi:hypothetical protein